MDLFVCRHGGSGVGILGVGGAAFGALGQGQDKDGAEMAGQKAQQLAAEGRRPGLVRVLTEELEPVCLVPAFGFGQGQQDVALFTLAVLCQIAVDGGLCAFVRQVLAPPAEVGRGGLAGFRGRCGGWLGLA